MTLGPGRHYGEWWGSGIQRKYNLCNGDKRFSLFNTVRWCLHDQQPKLVPSPDPRVVKTQDALPPCVGLVPVLWEGLFEDMDINAIINDLRVNGSHAAPGFNDPEGVVIYHVAAGVAFKKTLVNDETPKSTVSPA